MPFILVALISCACPFDHALVFFRYGIMYTLILSQAGGNSVTKKLEVTRFFDEEGVFYADDFKAVVKLLLSEVVVK